jgi:hypothetical protein
MHMKPVEDGKAGTSADDCRLFHIIRRFMPIEEFARPIVGSYCERRRVWLVLTNAQSRAGRVNGKPLASYVLVTSPLSSDTAQPIQASESSQHWGDDLLSDQCSDDATTDDADCSAGPIKCA